MDPFRASHARSVEEAERMSDALFVPLAQRVRAIVEDAAAGRETLTIHDYGPIMSRIDRELSRVYPELPGRSCALEETIVLAANRARVRGIKANMAPAVAAIRRADPALLRRLRHGA